MHNGYQIDPQSLMLQTLFDLKESNGRIEQSLDDGREFHRHVREKLENHGNRLIALEQKKDEGSLSSIVLQWIEVIKQIWPLLFLLTAIASAVGLHVPDGVKDFVKHSQTE
jgi:hypothetical protein